MEEWSRELLAVQETQGSSPYWLDSREFKAFRRRYGLDRRLWEAHHIIAVSEGGGMCGLENYETICLWCHKKETRELHRRVKRNRTEPGRCY